MGFFFPIWLWGYPLFSLPGRRSSAIIDTYQILVHWNTFEFVDEVSSRTHEKVVLQSPNIKKIMLKYLDLCEQHSPVINVFRYSTWMQICGVYYKMRIKGTFDLAKRLLTKNCKAPLWVKKIRKVTLGKIVHFFPENKTIKRLKWWQKKLKQIWFVQNFCFTYFQFFGISFPWKYRLPWK